MRQSSTTLAPSIRDQRGNEITGPPLECLVTLFVLFFSYFTQEGYISDSCTFRYEDIL